MYYVTDKYAAVVYTAQQHPVFIALLIASAGVGLILSLVGLGSRSFTLETGETLETSDKE